MATEMQSFYGFYNEYKKYRASGDVGNAKRYGESIMQKAERIYNAPNVSASDKEYCIKAAAEVSEFLQNPYALPAQKAAKKGGKNTEDIINSTDWFDAEIPQLDMGNVAGLANVRDAFRLVTAAVSADTQPIYRKYRKEAGMQVLLYGPPGTGKTHIVKCLAGQLKCKIAVVQIKDVMANLVGDGAKIIARIFEQAKKYDKCIIFFDEIDAIAAGRDNDESRHTKEQLTTLLTYMDGFTAGTKEGQARIVVAATNRPWVLDSAVKRGGRFETQIYVPLPDTEAREELVRQAIDSVPHRADVTPEWLAERFEGFAGADIKAACKQMANRPLLRELRIYGETKQYSEDCITREDCIYVLDRYINSVTDEMLFEFDAYTANTDLHSYYKTLRNRLEQKRADGTLQPHETRWLAAHATRSTDDTE